MKILVTGGCGFIGSNFVLSQIKKGDLILNYDKLTYAGNLNNLVELDNHANYSFIHGDICDNKKIKKIIKNFKPDAIVNFAAESHVDRSIESPFSFINTNIVGVGVLLDECFNYFRSLSKARKQKFRFIHISTDEVYGSLGESGYFSEETPYDPSSPYSASKASSDHLVRSWYRTYGLPTIITNCSNNYGPYQFPEKLIPLVIVNCMSEKNLPVYGKGKNIRDWLYVSDHCNAISKLIKKGKKGETYNIGGGNEMQNIEIIKIICRKMDKILPRKNKKKYNELISFVSDRPGHDFRYAIDSSKIQKDIGWKPKQNFDLGIDKTVRWYINNKKWWKKIQMNTYQQQRLGVVNK